MSEFKADKAECDERDDKVEGVIADLKESVKNARSAFRDVVN
jgi:hypothetical protein